MHGELATSVAGASLLGQGAELWGQQQSPGVTKDDVPSILGSGPHCSDCLVGDGLGRAKAPSKPFASATWVVTG